MPARGKVFLRGFSSKVFTNNKKHKLWEKEQYFRQRRIILRLFLFLVLAAIIFNLIFRFSQLSNAIFRPFNKLPTTITRNIGLDFKQRVNILLINLKSYKVEGLVLLSYEQKEEETTVVFLPEQVMVSLPKNYGTQTLDSSFWLGQTEEEKKGIDFLIAAVKKSLAVPIDSYIALEGVNLSEENLRKIKKELFSVSFFLEPIKKGWPPQGIKTDLSLKNFLLLSYKIKNTRSLDKLNFVYLDKTLREVTIDNKTVVNFDEEALDNILSENLVDTNLTIEHLKIEIRNATQVPGIGNFVSRVVANMGLEVVSVKNNEEPSSETLIYTKSAGKVERRLANFLQARIVKEELSESSGDLVIIVGKDFYHYLELIGK